MASSPDLQSPDEMKLFRACLANGSSPPTALIACRHSSGRRRVTFLASKSPSATQLLAKKSASEDFLRRQASKTSDPDKMPDWRSMMVRPLREQPLPALHLYDNAKGVCARLRTRYLQLKTGPARATVVELLLFFDHSLSRLLYSVRFLPGYTR